MKVLIVFAGLVFIASQVDARAISSLELTENEEACIRELHLNRDDIVALDMTKPLPETEEVVNYMSCFAKKQGMVTANEFDYDKFKEELAKFSRRILKFSPSEFRQYDQLLTYTISECHQSVDKENLGLTLIRTMSCMLEEVGRLKNTAD